ncbi:MAG: two-component regulator propeller domain-containing protein [Bacteroidota bacterium]
MNRHGLCSGHLVVCLVLLLMYTNDWLVAQLPTDLYKIERIGLEHGLSQSSINALAQDEKGFLWLATQDGLNKYDGISFEVFRNTPFDSTSLSQNFITSLLIDHKGRLWAGTISEGLNLYLEEEKKFLRFYTTPNDGTSLSGNSIKDIYQDRNNNIWVVTNNGLNQIVEEPEQENSFFFRRHLISDIVSPSYIVYPGYIGITKLYQDGHGHLWVGTFRGLLRFDYLDDHRINAPASLFDADYLQGVGGPVTSIIEDALGNLRICADGKLWMYDWNNQRFLPTTEYRSQSNAEDDSHHAHMYKNRMGDLLMIDQNRLLQLTTDDSGYAKKFEQVGQLDTLQYIPHPQYEQPFLEDRLHDGFYWIGTHIGGLVKMYKKRKRFHTNHLEAITKQYDHLPIVWNMVIDGDDNLWVRLEHGIAKIEGNGRGHHFWSKIQRLGERPLTGNMFSGFHRDRMGRIWIGGPMGLHQLIEQADGQLQATPATNSTECVDIGAFCFQELDEHLLIGAYSGFHLFDLRTKQFTRCPIRLYKDQPRPVGHRVNAILFDSFNNLWIGTHHGLAVYRNLSGGILDAIHREPEWYRHDGKDRSSLIGNNIYALVEDDQGRVWISTMTGLSMAIDLGDQLTFKSFTEADGLANSIIHGMLPEDNRRYLWLSTNNGLSKVDTRYFQFSNYSASDGLQSNEFNGKSVFKSDNGELFFGGINGLTYFHPTEIRKEHRIPPIWFTSLKVISGEEFSLLDQDEEIPVRLSYQQRSFAVGFIGLDYVNSDGLIYSYDLEGADINDVSIGKNRELYFSNLSPGNYTLRIRATTKDGVVNKSGKSLLLIIERPFWQSPWFYAGIGLLVLLCSASFFYLMYRLKLRQMAEVEAVRQLAAQDFHDELGSKLSIISLYSELSKKGVQKRDIQTPVYLDKVAQTSNSLYDSMKDLLWSLNPEKDSLCDLFLHLKDFGEELFTHSEIEFQSVGIDKPPKNGLALPMNYKRHILLIGKEAMHNCLRHADCHQVNLKMSYSHKSLTLRIEDDGKGFDPRTQRMGDGLHNMQSRARKINASLKINASHKGTKVQLVCPIQ